MKRLVRAAALGVAGSLVAVPMYRRYEQRQELAEIMDDIEDAQSTPMPETLPEAVAARVASVVDVGLIIPIEVRNAEEQVLDTFDVVSSMGSGVRIAPNWVLSAGHILLESEQESESQITCGDLYLQAQSIDGAGAHGATVLHETSSLSKGSSVPDIALYTHSVGGEFGSLPYVPIAQTPPQEGEVLYFINYEPTTEGKDRSPSESQEDVAMRQPAIYGGVLIGLLSGDYRIATGLKNYGSGVPETDSRQGASGGPVLNSAGELVGITTKVEAWVSDGIFKDEEMVMSSLTIVEPVNLALVASLEEKIAIESKACEPTIETQILYRD